MRVIKTWLTGAIVGFITGLSFILVERALAADRVFDAWEMGVASLAPGVFAIVVARVTGYRTVILLFVAYSTLLIPVLGPAFGGTGSEPAWAFGILGLVGGLVWTTPFALWALFTKGDKRGASRRH